MSSFVERLRRLQTQNGTTMLLLRPLMSEMPAPMHYHDDPFFPFSRAIIKATRDSVCGYLFDFAAYMAHGGAGAVALERSMAYAGGETIKVLHGAFAGPEYAPMVYDAFGADAATIASERDYKAFATSPEQEAFVISEEEPEANVPLYRVSAEQLRLANVTNMTVAGEDVLYSSYMDDFAEQCRATLEQMQG